MAPVLETRTVTAEEYLRTPDDGRVTELVCGRIVEMNRPYTAHGYFCFRIAMLLGQFVDQRGLGRIVTNDSGVITQRDPDTVRGPDVAFYSYHRIPRGPLPIGYWPVSPELVVEVLSPDDRWKDVLQKIDEYLQANVIIVAIVAPESRQVHLYSAAAESTLLTASDNLIFPDILPGFSASVSELFE